MRNPVSAAQREEEKKTIRIRHAIRTADPIALTRITQLHLGYTVANSAHAGPIPIVEHSLINNGRAASPPGASSPFPRLGTSGDSVENRGSNKCAIKPSLPLSPFTGPPFASSGGHGMAER